MSRFPYALSRRVIKPNGKANRRLIRIEESVLRTEISVASTADTLVGVVDCLDRLCGSEGLIVDETKIKFKVIL